MPELSDFDPDSATIADLVEALIQDEDAVVARETYIDAIATHVAKISAWLAVDAWLGAGDRADTSQPNPAPMDPARGRGFIGVGLVAQMSSELVTGAVLLSGQGMTTVRPPWSDSSLNVSGCSGRLDLTSKTPRSG